MRRERGVFFLCFVVIGCGTGVGTQTGSEGSLPACEEGATQCGDWGAKLCVNGEWAETSSCPAGENCIDGECSDCPHGKLFCAGSASKEVWACDVEEGKTLFVQECDGNSVCTNGFCINPCAPDIKYNTNVGCEYFAVDLENHDTIDVTTSAQTPANAQYAVIVSNPDLEHALDVSIHETYSGPPMPSHSMTLAPGGLQVIELPSRNLAGTMKGEHAYTIRGTRPFIAYQFNPLDNVNPVYSNDASLLLPISAAGTRYIAVTGANSGFVTVVATEGETWVTVVPTGEVQAGGEIEAILPGEEYQVLLQQGEVLNLSSGANGGADLTGTVIEGSNPIVVFSGSVLSATPGGKCCADHLEQQLVSVNKQGSLHVATHSVRRGVEKDWWRVIAVAPSTTITFEPPVAPETLLFEGEFIEFQSDKDFIVTGTDPIQVVQFLASSHEIVTMGAYCESDTDCPSNQECVLEGVGLGQCEETCKIPQSDCPSSQLGCTPIQDDELNAAGFCSPRPCLSSEGVQCGSLGTCIDELYQDGTGGCYEVCWSGSQCDVAGAVCEDWEGNQICLPPPSQCFADGDCPSGAECITYTDGSKGCVYTCTPQSPCADDGYQCRRFFTDSAKTYCGPDYCETTADCNAGHSCSLYEGETYGLCTPIGDPSMILSVPVAQFRDEYTFLVPDAYVYDYINIIAPSAASVELDGSPLSEAKFTAVGADFKVARMSVADGVHRVTASAALGVVVYGYDDDVSYGYPAGTNLSDLN